MADGGGETGYYGFNDVHATLARIGAGRIDEVAATLAAVEARGHDATTLGMMARDVAAPLIRGLLAHATGRHGEAVKLLLATRETSHRFGGSHAQRDLIELTLMDAAIRADQRALARRRLNERWPMKGASPLTALWARRVG